MGYVTMFQYEICTMDLEAAEACGKAWWAFLLDEISIDECIEQNQTAFEGYATRYIDEQGNEVRVTSADRSPTVTHAPPAASREPR